MSQLRWYHVIACVLALGLASGAGAQNTVGSAAAPAPASSPAASSALAGAMPEDLLPGLKPILARALARSPEQIRLGLEIERAEAHALVSRSAMLPNLGGYGRYSVNRAATASGTANAMNSSSGFFYDLGLTQPVYHWGALKAQADIDRISIKIAGREFAEAYRALAQQVRQRYLELVAKKMALRAEQRRLELSAKGLARDEERFKNNEITGGDIATARTLQQENQLALDRSVAELAFLKRAFLRFTGLEELADEAIPADIPSPAAAADKGNGLLSEFLRAGAASTYRGQIFSLNIRQSDLNYAIAKTGLYPKLSFNAGRNVSNLTQADVNQVRQEAIVQTNYGLIVNWTIFDSLATRGRKLEALAQKRANERQLQTYVEATTDLAQHLRQQAEFAARGLAFAETRLGGARTGVDQAKQDLGRGRASPQDVERAEAALLAAEAATAFARAEYLNRWTEFVSLVGADPVMNNLSSRYVR